MYSYATGHPPRVDLFTNDAQTSLGEHLLGLNLYERRDTTKDTRINLTHPLINLTQVFGLKLRNFLTFFEPKF